MDIQKIKELALANGFKLKEQASGNMDLNAYVYDFANAVEQEAKAQAVPEGFVVLAIDDMERICRCLDDHAVYITYKASDALESIQKAMTEAQEQK